LLNHDTGIPITYCIFDVLEHNGELTLRLPYRERRQLLDSLHMNGPNWQTAPSFPDADALVDVVNNRGLEGIVAKRSTGPTGPTTGVGRRSRTAVTGASNCSARRSAAPSRRAREVIGHWAQKLRAAF
jgi:bifunctional non-homologous end joining protein LigD